jgi:hypothetical protein
MAFELNRDLPSGVSGNYWKISSALVACNTDYPTCDVYLELFLTRQARLDGKAALLTQAVGIPLEMVDMSFSFDFRACLYNAIKTFPSWSSAIDIFDDPNLTPVVNDVSFTTDFETAKIFTLSAYDNFNKPLTFTITQPANGVISVSNGVYTYTPNTGFYGVDTASYIASNVDFDSASKTITATVNDTPSRPTANDVSGTTISVTPVEITLDGSDPNSLPLIYSISTLPTNGSVTEIDGIATYTANVDFVGNDEFKYKSYNGTYESTEAAVTISVGASE